MSDGLSPIERSLERIARGLSGGQLHPAELLQRVQTAALAAVRDGVVPNRIVVAMHPADYRHYRPVLADLQAELSRMLDAAERRDGLTRVGERIIEIVESRDASPSLPAVTATFADTANRPLAPAPRATVTRRLARHRDAELVLGDGSRIRLTHTPFTIGRGPGNDLVLASLAVSRDHAVITRDERGFVISDAGSRNGILCDGVRHNAVALLPGLVVRLGDVDLRLEELP